MQLSEGFSFEASSNVSGRVRAVSNGPMARGETRQLNAQASAVCCFAALLFCLCRLQALHVPLSALSFGGIKDKVAVTTQVQWELTGLFSAVILVAFFVYIIVPLLNCGV